MKATVTITGLKELESNAQVLVSKVVPMTSRKSVTKAAAVVRTEMQTQAPTDTRNLKRSIVSVVSNIKGRRWIQRRWVSVRTTDTPERDEPRVAYYYFMIEFGTRFMSANPFMRRTYEASKGRAVTAYQETFKRLFPQDLAKRIKRAKR